VNIPKLSAPRLLQHYLPAVITLITSFTLGCGSNPTSTAPPPPANTSVVLLTSSTANNQVSQYALELSSLTLTSQSGTTVNVFSTPQTEEFIHLNAIAEPLLTVSIPQGVYTSATATVTNSSFTVDTLNSSGGILYSIYGGPQQSSQTTVNLPTPVTITGTTMGLSLNLLVEQSATFPSPPPSSGIPVYSINPTFNLTPLTISSQPTNTSNGKLPGLSGRITSLNATTGSLTVTSPNGPIWTLSTNSQTVYQGVANISALTTGTAVNLDASIQSDGSLLATRIQAENPNTSTSPYLSNEPVMFVESAMQYLFALGPPFISQVTTASNQADYFSNAAFETSGQLANLQSLPFTPSFTGSNVVAGQMISITGTAPTAADPYDITANTIMLVPQTINGTISAVSSNGSFDTYTVTLAPYDFFPDFAVQSQQTTLLTNPNTVIVYMDSNTQLLNTNPLTTGSLIRFYGLVFNDGGILKMDCAQINDGVTE
jgi:hypothetical protein